MEPWVTAGNAIRLVRDRFISESEKICTETELRNIK
jgi:hypothetical protein